MAVNAMQGAAAEAGVLASRTTRKLSIALILIAAALALLKKRARDQLYQCLGMFLPGFASANGYKLKVRVVKAQDLRTTAGGKVSDPYVFVRVGKDGHKLPATGDESSPMWTGDNLFTFAVNLPSTVEVEVMTKCPVLARSSVGRTQVDLGSLKLRKWNQFREELQGSVAGTMEFEVRLDRA